LAAETLAVSVWRKLIYSLIWQSVMWRPGKLWFLIGVKNRFLSGRPRPPANAPLCGAAPFARFATSVGLRPPFIPHPATLSHPDCRAVLILFVAHHSQLQQEFGAVLSYERLWRLPIVGDNRFGVDIVPQFGASVGNIYTYGETGVLLRIGRGLGADYGPVRVRPALSGTDYFDADGLDEGRGYYFFAGTQGRVVGRNIFLDGNSFRTSPSVSKKNLVGDAQAGFSVLWSKSLRLDISVALRTEEFHGQRTPDDICTAALTFTW